MGNKTIKGQKELCDLIWGINTKEDLHDAITDLLTPAEIEAVGERIEIMKQLKQDKPQREIAANLGVSITTVSRGAKVLKYGSGFTENYF